MVLKKMIVAVGMIAGLSMNVNAYEFNQSNALFEERCKAGFDGGSGCGILGMRHEKGVYYEYTDRNIETKVKKDLNKARNYYKMACEQGDKDYCKDYERLSK